jgi:hypothetical protein
MVVKMMLVRRRSCAARALRPALLVMLLIDAVLATEAAAPAAQAAHWPPRTRRRRRLLDALPPARGAAVTTTGCNGFSADLAPDQCAAWGQFWDGAGGPNWTNQGQGCTKIDPCAPYCGASYGGSITCRSSSIYGASSITGM